MKILKDELKNGDRSKEEFAKIKIWNLRNKFCNKFREPPNAMLDDKGNLLTNEASILEAAQKAHTDRLLPNQMRSNLEQYRVDVNNLCESRLRSTIKNKTKDWELSDLKQALKELNKNKSADSMGYINELFQEDTAGDDLILALLKLINKIKSTLYLPSTLTKVSVTSVNKSKARNNFDNYRGIFRLPVIRCLIDKLLYLDIYPTIDEKLSDCSNGARKCRGVRDNIFIVNSISNSVINGEQEPIVIEVMDMEKCFDKLWLEATINAFYECGINNDKLNLIYILNNKSEVAVKIGNTSSKKTTLVKNVVMQGSVMASLQCTTLQDSFNRIHEKYPPLNYFYKNDTNIQIGMLGFVDDTLSIQKCGNLAIEKNAASNSFVDCTNQKKKEDKTNYIHIGNKKFCKEKCPNLIVNKSIMKETSCSKYLGNFISTKNNTNNIIEARRKKGFSIIPAIESILDEVNFGSRRIQAALLLQEACLHSSMLFCAEVWFPLTIAYISKSNIILEGVLRSVLCPPSRILHPTCSAYISFNNGQILMFKVSK